MSTTPIPDQYIGHERGPKQLLVHPDFGADIEFISPRAFDVHYEARLDEISKVISSENTVLKKWATMLLKNYIEYIAEEEAPDPNQLAEINSEIAWQNLELKHHNLETTVFVGEPLRFIHDPLSLTPDVLQEIEELFIVVDIVDSAEQSILSDEEKELIIKINESNIKEAELYRLQLIRKDLGIEEDDELGDQNSVELSEISVLDHAVVSKDVMSQLKNIFRKNIVFRYHYNKNK